MLTRWKTGWIVATMAALSPWLAAVLEQDGFRNTTLTPILVFAAGIFFVLAVWTARQDLWLGVLVGWVTVRYVTHMNLGSFETTVLMVFGCVGIACVQRMNAVQRGTAGRLLVIAGLAQVALAIGQAIGVDLYWWHEFGVVGTLGNQGYLGLFLATIAPIAPIALIPLFVLGVLLTKSSFAMIGMAVGLGVRFRQQWEWMIVGASMALSAFMFLRPAWVASMHARITIWVLSLDAMHWWTWLVGNGPGSWADLIPRLQLVNHVMPTQLFAAAHNDWYQLLFETGLVSFLIIGLWVWSHRARFDARFSGGVAALSIMSLGWFPFHIANVALPALTVIGCATPSQLEEGG